MLGQVVGDMVRSGGFGEAPALPTDVRRVPEVAPGQMLAVPKKEPEAQPQFELRRLWEWKYWEEVTGLTGTALVVYLIISEGSRLYPPRNALALP